MSATDSEFLEFLEPPRAKRGRGSVLTLPRVEQLVTIISAGNYVTAACGFAAISESTFHSWRARGEIELDRVASIEGVDLPAILETAFSDPDALTAAHMWDHKPARFTAREWPFVVFHLQMQRARAAAEMRIVQVIHKAAMAGDWRAGAWWLERTMPDRYGARDRLALEGSDGGPVKVETVVTVEELNSKLAKVIETGRGGQEPPRLALLHNPGD